MSSPRFAAALSTEPDTARAEAACLADLRRGLEGRQADLILAFVSPHHREELEDFGPRLARETGCPAVVGCTASAVVGGGREVEDGPGLSLWAACLPGTRVEPFDIQAGQAEEGLVFSALPPVEDASRASLLLFADPFTFPMEPYLRALATQLPGVQAMGGLASGGSRPGENALYSAQGNRVGGALGVVLEGDVELRPVVSQGCRPVGRPWVVTDSESNVIRRLGGKPALQGLMETWQSLDPPEQQLLRQSPFVGLAYDAAKSEFGRGDFLARPIVGLDQDKGWVAVADRPRKGMTVQFLVRDAASAGEDLRDLLAEDAWEGDPREVGALLFTCNGRGTHMFGEPDHDVGCVEEALDPRVPLAGFFCSGEIGPVGRRNWLHGFTASVAVFQARRG